MKRNQKVQEKPEKHTSKHPIETPRNLDKANSVLEGIEKELEFYRRRAGQVFFMGLFVEVLILAGKERVIIPEITTWFSPLVYTFFFMLVASIGIVLGSEYRSRIRILKDSRIELLEKIEYKYIYPRECDQRLSEIQVLYIVLTFLSSCGIVLIWLKHLKAQGEKTLWFKAFCFAFIGIALLGLLYSLGKLIRFLFRLRRS